MLFEQMEPNERFARGVRQPAAAADAVGVAFGLLLGITATATLGALRHRRRPRSRRPEGAARGEQAGQAGPREAAACASDEVRGIHVDGAASLDGKLAEYLELVDEDEHVQLDVKDENGEIGFILSPCRWRRRWAPRGRTTGREAAAGPPQGRST